MYKRQNLYFQRHDGQAATCEDFLLAMQDASGKNLSSMMAWYTQSGTPELKASMMLNSENNELELNIKQFNPPTSDSKEKKPLPILLEVGMLDYDGKEYLIAFKNGNTLKPLKQIGKTKKRGTRINFLPSNIEILISTVSSFKIIPFESEP